MKDVKVVKKSFIISGVLVFIVSVFLTYIGLIAKTNFANIDADIAVLQSFTQLVPNYLIPFVTVAFFAAILSTADTFLFLLGINSTNDFLGNKIKSKKEKVKYTRFAILIIGFLALILALIYPNIVEITIIFKAIGLIVAPIVLISWLSGGNSKTIIYTLVTLSVLIIGLALIGYIKPELTIIGSIGGLLLYGFYSLLFKIIRKSSPSPKKK